MKKYIWLLLKTIYNDITVSKKDSLKILLISTVGAMCMMTPIVSMAYVLSLMNGDSIGNNIEMSIGLLWATSVVILIVLIVYKYIYNLVKRINSELDD